MKRYIIASNKSWNVERFIARRSAFPGSWIVVTNPLDLNADLLRLYAPRYIFFLHWSSIVSSELLELSECVCFHMTDLPFGRGGSPLQNLIARGHKSTMLTALRMTEDLDAGPIYAKVPLSLSGSASTIFERCADLALDVMSQIAVCEPIPEDQAGIVTHFRRRTPDQSELPSVGSMRQLYDHIRMLDAETYPRAFLDFGDYRIELSSARLDEAEERVEAVARFSRRQQKGELK